MRTSTRSETHSRKSSSSAAIASSARVTSLTGGGFPEETISLLRERAIPCIRGNHDRWAIKDGHDMSGWDLTDRAISFLEGLPVDWRQTLDGVHVSVTHARPGSDMQGVYPDASAKELEALIEAADADVLIVGHTHLPMRLTLRGGAVVANPRGAASRSRPSDGGWGDALRSHAEEVRLRSKTGRRNVRRPRVSGKAVRGASHE